MRIFSNVKPEVSKKNYGSTKYKQHKKSIFVTLVKWLDEWLAPAKNLNIKRVLVLQINPFPQAPQDRGDRKVGWFMATIGPLLTAFKVRDPVLTARNATEVEILRERWKNEKNTVKIEYFPIFFPSAEKMEEKKECYGSQRDSFYQKIAMHRHCRGS